MCLALALAALMPSCAPVAGDTCVIWPTCAPWAPSHTGLPPSCCLVAAAHRTNLASGIDIMSEAALPLDRIIQGDCVEALDRLDLKTYRRRVETVVSKLGHIRA